MPELRWILALAGLGIVLFVYLISRRRSARDQADAEARIEPDFAERAAPVILPDPGPDESSDGGMTPLSATFDDDEPDDFEPLRGAVAESVEEPLVADFPDDSDTFTGDEVEENLDWAGQEEKSGLRPAPPDEERVIAIRLKARNPEGFDGASLLRSFSAGGLRFGRFGIFHHEEAGGNTAFSVASIVEPGTFDPETLPETGCPGITLFMVVPGPVDPIVGLHDMLTLARGLAADLDGELLDERGVSFTPQREAQLREEISELVRRLGGKPGAGFPAAE